MKNFSYEQVGSSTKSDDKDKEIECECSGDEKGMLPMITNKGSESDECECKCVKSGNIKHQMYDENVKSVTTFIYDILPSLFMIIAVFLISPQVVGAFLIEMVAGQEKKEMAIGPKSESEWFRLVIIVASFIVILTGFIVPMAMRVGENRVKLTYDQLPLKTTSGGSPNLYYIEDDDATTRQIHAIESHNNLTLARLIICVIFSAVVFVLILLYVDIADDKGEVRKGGRKYIVLFVVILYMFLEMVLFLNNMQMEPHKDVDGKYIRLYKRKKPCLQTTTGLKSTPNTSIPIITTTGLTSTNEPIITTTGLTSTNANNLNKNLQD